MPRILGTKPLLQWWKARKTKEPRQSCLLTLALETRPLLSPATGSRARSRESSGLVRNWPGGGRTGKVHSRGQNACPFLPSTAACGPRPGPSVRASSRGGSLTPPSRSLHLAAPPVLSPPPVASPAQSLLLAAHPARSPPSARLRPGPPPPSLPCLQPRPRP